MLNIIFILADQHRWDFMGYEHNGVTLTPNLDALARRGVIFRSAYCNAPLCSPSRQAIHSGRYGMNSGSFTNLHQLPAGTPSFVSQLRAAGYHTCAIGKTHMEIHAYDSDLTSAEHARYMDSLGWDEVHEISGNGMLKTGIRCAYTQYLRERGIFGQVLEFYRNWHYFMDRSRKGDPDFCPHEWPLDEKDQETTFLGNRACDWLRGIDAQQPFFLHLGFAGPHSPIEPHPRFLDLYRDREETSPWGSIETPEFTRAGRRGYRAMISQIDFQVGRVMDILAERGLDRNTIVLYSADHGEMAGDHGIFGKTRFFESSVRVPLIISGPGINAGRDSRALVELVDLGRTVCDLCDVEPHVLDQGRSLLPILRGESGHHRDTVYTEMGCDRMLFDGRYKLMYGDPGLDTRKLGKLHLDKPVTIAPSPARLYDLEADPHEEHDLARDPDAKGLLMEMQQKLLARINENLQPLPNLDRGEYRPL